MQKSSSKKQKVLVKEKTKQKVNKRIPVIKSNINLFKKKNHQN